MKLWAHISNGIVDEPPIELPDNLKPGVDIFTPEHAASMIDVTACNPVPGIGWSTADNGKTFTAPEDPSPIIPDVDAVYALIQLSRTKTADGSSDLLTATRGIVAKSSAEVQVWFERAPRWMRKDPHVAQVAKALNLSDDKVDSLFIAAAKIPLETAQS